MWKFHGVEIHWLGHDSFMLKGSRTVVIDPFKTKSGSPADLVLISHEHFDHLSPEDLKKFARSETTVIAPRVCSQGLEGYGGRKVWVEPGMKVVEKGVTVEAIPAYNLNKYREPGKVFHPKEDGRVGFIVTLDGTKFYHAGDSDATPEMKSVEVDVALLPVSGTYVMTAEEAAEAAKAMKASVFIPMHYSKIVGTKEDAERFRRLVEPSREVQVLEEE